MAVYACVGSTLNHLGRIQAIPTFVAGSADASFPITKLYDGVPGDPFRFAAVIADSEFKWDLNLVVNGGAETGTTDATSWSEVNTGTGAATRSTVAGEFNEGVAGFKFVSGTGTTFYYQDIVVRAGERLNLTAMLKGDGTRAVVLRVQNLYTNMNLTSAGAWQSGAADVYSNATNAWVTQATRTFTVESYTLCLYDTVTLRITIGCATASGTVFADAVYCWPDSDIMAVLGHNMSTVLVPTWRHSDDNASFTTVSTMTIARPSFFVAPTTSTKRYQSLKLTGTPRVAPYIGELIQSQRKTLSNDILPSMQIASTVLQTRSADRAHQYGSDLVRTIACKMKHFGVANYKEYRDEVFERSSGGASPILLVPISTETDVFYGRIRETWSAVRQGPQFWSESSFTLTELATPMNMGT